MSDNEQQREQIQVSMEQAKANMKRRDSLFALYQNADFKEVILKGYFEQESIRLVMVKADDNAQEPEMQAGIDRSITGIGALNRYFAIIKQFGDMAEKALEDAQREQNRIDNGEVE